jgi:hypothetical protein
MKMPPGEIPGGLLDDERPMGLGNFAGGDRPDAAQLPALLSIVSEMGAQKRRLKKIEERQRELRVALGHVAAKINAQREYAGLDRGKTVLDEIVEVVGYRAHDGHGLEVLNGGDTGNRRMAARGSQQRNVIAKTLVAIGPAKIEDSGVDVRGILGVRQIRLRRDHPHPGNIEQPILRIADDDDDIH